MKKVLRNLLNQPVGELGEYAGYLDFHVGDTVEVYCENGIRREDSIIVKIRGRYLVYGWEKPLEEMHEAGRVKKKDSFTDLRREFVIQKLLKLTTD